MSNGLQGNSARNKELKDLRTINYFCLAITSFMIKQQQNLEVEISERDIRRTVIRYYRQRTSTKTNLHPTKSLPEASWVVYDPSPQHTAQQRLSSSIWLHAPLKPRIWKYWEERPIRPLFITLRDEFESNSVTAHSFQAEKTWNRWRTGHKQWVKVVYQITNMQARPPPKNVILN